MEVSFCKGKSLLIQASLIKKQVTNFYAGDKNLFLCNTFVKFNNFAARAFEKILALFQFGASRTDIMKEIIPLVFSKQVDTPELREQIFNFVNSDPFWQTAYDYERQLKALKSFDSSEWIDKVATPTVVVASEEDITALPEESQAIAKKIKHSTLEILPGGHASAIEQPKSLAELFTKHLNTQNIAMA